MVEPSRRTPQRRRRGHTGRSGFSIVEVLITVMVLSITVPLLGAYLEDVRHQIAFYDLRHQWQDEARGFFKLLNREVHESLVPPDWDGETLSIQGPEYRAVYRVDRTGYRVPVLVRFVEQDGHVTPPTVLSQQVSSLRIDIEDRRFAVVLQFQATFDGYHAERQHQTVVSIPNLYHPEEGNP